ncbi:MAG TPA: ABC transporter permease [Vicinamibacterales bacterium]|jgi:predicted permease|nr:ABC transporter permease [Vicinamibacterales bacterium]
MRAIWQDVRYGFRGLYKQPGFTALAVLTLALGIGAATTMYSAIHNILIDPYPFPDVDRFVTVQIHDSSRARPGGRIFFQVPEFLDLQEQNHVFEEVIGGAPEDVLQKTNEGTEQFVGGAVTANNFQFLGVPALMGRGLVPDDAKPGAPPVFVMSYKMWTGRYNQDPGVLGRTFVLNGVPTICVGVMPQRFHKLAADLYRPIVLSRADPQVNRRFFMFQARLKRGVTKEQASADVDVIVRRLSEIYPQNYPKQFTVRVLGWAESIVGQFQTTLYTLAAAVALLLLIACSNVANMLLARGAAREREMAIRLSLGASRSRVVRQLLVESLLLAGLGALIGCVFAYGGIKVLVQLMPEGLVPREAQIRLNTPVLIFSVAAAIWTALIFGLVPALQTARRDMVEPLKSSGKGTGGGFQRAWLRNALVVAEVALALMLVAGAGLLMRSFVNLQRMDLGLNPERVVTARVPLPRDRNTLADKKQFFEALLPRLQALPGVVAATATSTLPPYGGINSTIEIPGQSVVEQRRSLLQLVSEGYFQTLGLRLIRGRLLSRDEVTDARRVAVVNQTLVDRFFGAADGSVGDPIGQRIKFTFLETPPGGSVENPVFEIVGVIADAMNQGLQDPLMPEAFVPYTTTGVFERGVLVKTATDPAAMVNSIRREIWAVDRNVAVTNAGTLTEFLKRFSYAEPRLGLVLLGIFAGLGLLLVGVGVYSVIAYTVSRQTQEIGIRMALGARQIDVLGLVVRMGLRLLALGVGVGFLASLGVTRVLSYQLTGISPRDPLTLVIAIGVMLLAGLAACYFPARRAIKVDPMVALRYE